MKTKNALISLCLSLAAGLSPVYANAAFETQPTPLINGGEWFDTVGERINCHGGNIIKTDSLYYWYGEHRPGFDAAYQKGVACYSSPDLRNWRNEGIVFEVVADTTSLVRKGCTIERPKVVYNPRTKQYVLWFHHELAGKGYGAAYAAVATSKSPTGPFKLIRTGRVNPGKYPLNFDKNLKNTDLSKEAGQEWWTPQWREAVKKGLFVQRDLNGGQMARDMTIFVDEDGKAYHIFSSEENQTLHIAELSKDYTRHTGKYIRIFPGGANEAPVVFKKDGKYWLIASGCTGWAPNEARMFSSDNIMGEWKEEYPTPFKGEGSDKTFGGQGAFPLTIDGDVYFFADQWRPGCLADSRYYCLPIGYDSNGTPEIPFAKVSPLLNESNDGYKLIWSDEFDKDGKPDEKYWNYEEGFVRNHEDQWYQKQNAYCKDGLLILEARKENRSNPRHKADYKNWKEKRPVIQYTSASINTRDKFDFRYGRMEVRARIPVGPGAWPAIWTLGKEYPWPSNGEIDIMEYYRVNDIPHILANAAWGTDKPYNAKWNSKKVPFSHFLEKDPEWASKFHTWTMDWDEDFLKIYLDGELLNEIDLSTTVNGNAAAAGKNPMHQPHYILLNLALGGDNGGKISDEAFPMKYEIDYVRVYEKK